MMGARRFQQEFLDTVVLKAAQAAHTGSHPFTIVGNIYPGSGKTLTALNRAMRCSSAAISIRS